MRCQRSASSLSKRRLVWPARRSAIPSATYLQSVTTMQPPLEAVVSAAQSAAHSSARPTVCLPRHLPTWNCHSPSLSQATAHPAVRRAGSRPQTALPSVQQMEKEPSRGGRSSGVRHVVCHSRTLVLGGAHPDTIVASPRTSQSPAGDQPRKAVSRAVCLAGQPQNLCQAVSGSQQAGHAPV